MLIEYETKTCLSAGLLIDWSLNMNQKNIEMIDELRKFVNETSKNPDRATPAQLEAMTKVAEIVLRYS